MEQSLESLASEVNAWCDKRRIRPANGQAATAVTLRTLRYYRAVNLLDAPTSGGGGGYGKRHFLQACAVRVLQAEGLPISRIQSLLFGRSDKELQAVVEGAAASLPTAPESPSFTQPETWQTWPVTPDVMIMSRRPGLHLSPAQLAAIQQIINS